MPVASSSPSELPLPADALPLSVQGAELLVGGASPGSAAPAAPAAPLLTGLAPGLTARQEEGGSLVLGLDLGSSSKPLHQADVALGQVSARLKGKRGEGGGTEQGRRLHAWRRVRFAAAQAPFCLTCRGTDSIREVIGCAPVSPAH